MYNGHIMQTNLFESFSYLMAQTLLSVSLFLPKILGALLAFSLGAIVAKAVKSLVFKLLEAIRFSTIIKKTPLQFALENENLGKKAEEVVSSLAYWLTMLVVIYTTVAILGLTSLTFMLEKILSYIPKVISAIFILAFGVLLAGWAENLVKGVIKNVDPKSSRMLGKFSSYLILGMVLLISLSELGIASEFITILFIGLIGAISLGLGLALGLGGKDLISKLLNDWYKNNAEPIKIKEDNKKSKK